MRFIKSNGKSIAKLDFGIGFSETRLCTAAMLDSGTPLTTTSLGCLCSVGLKSNAVGDICNELLIKYTDKLMKFRFSTGDVEFSLPVLVNKLSVLSYDDIFVYDNIIVNLLLNADSDYVRLGWDFMMSHKNIINSSDYTELSDFDSDMYRETICDIRCVSSRELRSVFDKYI